MSEVFFTSLKLLKKLNANLSHHYSALRPFVLGSIDIGFSVIMISFFKEEMK